MTPETVFWAGFAGGCLANAWAAGLAAGWKWARERRQRRRFAEMMKQAAPIMRMEPAPILNHMEPARIPNHPEGRCLWLSCPVCRGGRGDA